MSWVSFPSPPAGESVIVDDPRSHFIFIYHPLTLMGRTYTVRGGRPMTNGEVLQYWGKWIVLGTRARLDELAEKLDPFVEERKIPCIKYDRSPPADLGLRECVMMVYCDRRERSEVWAILERFGVRMKAWVTERETMEMWLPGAQLLDRWLGRQDLDAPAKEAIREDARARIRYVFDHPDEIFRPWEQ
ncbi:MAG: hypothetical protein AB1640_00005 [bacterium]